MDARTQRRKDAFYDAQRTYTTVLDEFNSARVSFEAYPLNFIWAQNYYTSIDILHNAAIVYRNAARSYLPDLYAMPADNGL